MTQQTELDRLCDEYLYQKDNARLSTGADYKYFRSVRNKLFDKIQLLTNGHAAEAIEKRKEE